MKFLKYVLFLLILVAFVVLGLYISFNKSIPEGVSGTEADALAEKMLASINDDKWQLTGAVQWEFSRNGVLHKHIWDKERHYAQVEFEGHLVQIDINAKKGIVLSNSESFSTLKKVDLCEKAWKLWINDSFWLNPISKVFDPGTNRKLVSNEDGSQGLLISYESGGSTPGDSYLWILDNNFRPKAWQFWVSIIPIGGLEFSWEGWTKLNTGVFISTQHYGLTDIFINNVRGKESLNELTGGRDIFSGLEKAEINF